MRLSNVKVVLLVNIRGRTDDTDINKKFRQGQVSMSQFFVAGKP